MNRRTFGRSFVGACVGLLAGALGWKPQAKHHEEDSLDYWRLQTGTVPRPQAYYVQIVQNLIHDFPDGKRIVVAQRTLRPFGTTNRSAFRRLLKQLGRLDTPGKAGYWYTATLRRTRIGSDVFVTRAGWARDKGVPA